MPTATGTFQITTAGEVDLDDLAGEVRITHASGRQRFSGGLDADGAIDWLMVYRPDKTASFVGVQRIDGTVDGRSGSFAMTAVGEHDGSSSRVTWTVVAGSGTDALRGIRGHGSLEAPGGPAGTYELEYELR
ncbi:MAG TPA: DUF3224 domain-containing protein [Candidatus Limnocylindrales bacterium]|nr:DUF3224 domain-containing protein [Candidatus Limnocylindrales bacterium]